MLAFKRNPKNIVCFDRSSKFLIFFAIVIFYFPPWMLFNLLQIPRPQSNIGSERTTNLNKTFRLNHSLSKTQRSGERSSEKTKVANTGMDGVCCGYKFPKGSLLSVREIHFLANFTPMRPSSTDRKCNPHP